MLTNCDALGVSTFFKNLSEEIILCSSWLHLFDKKYSKDAYILKLLKFTRTAFSILIYFKM